MGKYEEALEIAKNYYPDNQFLDTIFPELRKSEDERIRKSIIHILQVGGYMSPEEKDKAFAYLEKQKEKSEKLIIPEEENKVMKAIDGAIRVYGKTQGEWIDGYDMDTLVVHLRKAFAALEKQKEQKPEEDLIENRKRECPFMKALDNNLYGCARYNGAIGICDGRCSWVVDYTKLKEIQDKRKQKPSISCGHENDIEWSEEDKKKISELKTFIAQCNGFNKANRQKAFELIDSLRPKAKQEWSKEDEINLTDAISAIEHLKNDCDWGYIGIGNDIDNVLNFLKSLPERFNLPSKHEWSEEDEEHYTSIINDIKQNVIPDEEDMNWFTSRFKSLRLQLSWKPTEEQMGALNYAYGELFKREDVGHNILGPLQKLIDQLNKLM